MRLPRLLEFALLAAVAAGLAYCLWGYWHDRRLAGRFAEVQLGMDRKAAEALLGAPDWEGGCGEAVAYLQRENCRRELGFSSAFAPLFPDHYVIQLDRNGRVVEAQPVKAQ